MTTYKLSYFNGRGRADTIRYVFAAAKQEFTDDRVADWPAFKPKTPFGQMPVLEVTADGKTQMFGESGAILRYVAREFGFYGSSNLDGLKIDQYVEIFTSVFEGFAKIRFGTPEAEREAAFKAFYEGDLVKKFGFADTGFGQTEGPYLLGDKLCVADIMFARLVDDIDTDGAVTKKFANLQKARDALDKEFKAFRDARPT
eukprot:CAMPEP_0168523450 /NCGR_PEP_ID=MMETSP0405-20121227/9991_1 /TAXON_ID=498012 /ORGANISM="Trichosphaerium sp, Strain Am-I-7 wt" /LENGTH=199 /DNA_ID=CAMNT_0008545327 /DNA_START=31 /DNA_END=626 /DNA_ORIENTATION=+